MSETAVPAERQRRRRPSSREAGANGGGVAVEAAAAAVHVGVHLAMPAESPAEPGIAPPPLSPAEADPAARTYRTMRELPGDDRPRERLIEHGPSVLSEAELVAVILGSGLAGENVLDLARRIVESAGGLAGLLRADVASLRTTKGVGPAKAALLAAAIELGRRLQGIDPESRPRLLSGEAVYYHLRGRLAGRAKETLFVLSLDAKGRLLSTAIAAEGTLSAVQWRAADIFRDPILAQASSIILVHNHPSGDPVPSPQDITSTRQLAKTGTDLGIPVHDHVVIGQNRFASLRAMGLIQPERA